MRRLVSASYPLVCTLAGLVLGWLPYFLHGPIPEKLAAARLNPAFAVWTYYCSRLLIGFMVGSGVWPAAWWLRGPLYGALLMLPPGMLALATPGCGVTCFRLNVSTGALVGLLVGATARLVTGRSRAE